MHQYIKPAVKGYRYIWYFFASCAILYDAETRWVNKAFLPLEKIAKKLYDNHFDYDIIPADYKAKLQDSIDANAEKIEKAKPESDEIPKDLKVGETVLLLDLNTIATVLISTPALRPITVGITQFSSFNMIEWQYLFAAALVATVPVVLLFLCIEKHLAAGLTAGGVKG